VTAPEDLGPPSSYLALERGTPVYSADGDEVGIVEHVLEDDREDVFDGIVIAHADEHHHRLGHREPHCFADADEIESIHDRGVVLKLSTVDSASLPKPRANPAVMREDPTIGGDTPGHQKLSRAWDLLSGKRYQ
jgi:uncharacterized protein YrrD